MTDAAERMRAIASDLLAQAQMPEADVPRRVSLAADADYWRQLAPQLSVAGAPRLPAPTLEPDALDAARRHFAAEGYFQTAALIDPPQLSHLNGAIDAVSAAGWPPVFAWLYDEFWALARLPELSDLLASQIGAGYAQIPHIWTHVVPAMVGSAGWAPHFDGPTSGRASIWIALTDATLANGCMHVVSHRRLAGSFATEPIETGMVSLADALRALHGVRALPVTAGSVLGWTFDVLHWGGPCLSPSGARRAVSMEFLAAGASPNPDEMPLLRLADTLPSFLERLHMVATAVLAYEKFEPGLVRYRAVAKQLR